jgi:5'-nucleotidase
MDLNTQTLQPLVIAVSSRALFDLQEGHRIFETQGVEAYRQYQVAHEHLPLAPGPGYGIIKKFLSLNAIDLQPGARPSVEVILLSRNSADTGLRIFNTIDKESLWIKRAAFTGGTSPYPYAQAFGADLFLSADPHDVANALQNQMAAATLLAPGAEGPLPNELRIAFDGDSVLFSDEAERIYQTQDLTAFEAHEIQWANRPLPGGPFKAFLNHLNNLQKVQRLQQGAPIQIRTALVTARGAPAHERVIRTLRSWDIEIDEAFFLGGGSKTQFLKAFKADLFFDDQKRHCDPAKEAITVGHVPHGIMNAN